MTAGSISRKGLRRPVDRDYYTMTSPPVIVRGVIVVGSSVMDWWGKAPSPPGDVRGFDVVTGRLLWTFHTVAQGEEPGVETWQKDSWKEAGNANVWAPMSADEELGYVYLPVSTPTNDYYGGHRPGDGLYGDSLVCLDAATGKKVWHYQLVHHGLWDYDTAGRAEPDRHHRRRKADQGGGAGDQAGFPLRVRSRHRPAGVADRGAAGAGVERARRERIEDAAVSDEAGADRHSGRARRRPDRSHAGDPQGGKDIAAKYDHGPLFTPPSQRGTIQVPGNAGGGNWSGAAIDPETGMLYVGTHRLPLRVTVRKPEPWQVALRLHR